MVRSVYSGYLQLQVRWNPVWLDGRDIRAGDFGVGILIGKVAVALLVDSQFFWWSQLHSPDTCHEN
jgi:hypothetical protein